MIRLDEFTRRTFQLGAVASLFALAWVLVDAFVLLFAGILVATAASAMARGLARITRLPRAATLTAVVLALPAMIIGITLLIGPRVLGEVNKLREQLPAALDAANAWLEQQSQLGLSLRDLLGNAAGNDVPWASVASFATLGVGGLIDALLVLFIGIYLAASPAMYLRGVVRLVPDRARPRVAHALEAAGNGLQAWLLGQLMSMAVIGVLTGLGLWLLGMPMAGLLGVLAGLLTFVPFVGPLLFAIIAVIFAFAQGPMQALYVLLLSMGVQQLEGDVITPLIQRWAVALPPLLSLMSVVVFGMLFGVMGVLLASPMAVVAMILVEKLYLDTRAPPDATL